MTDILIRICVGACGVLTFALGVRLSAERDAPKGTWVVLWGVMTVGLTSILRALGVL